MSLAYSRFYLGEIKNTEAVIQVAVRIWIGLSLWLIPAKNGAYLQDKP